MTLPTADGSANQIQKTENSGASFMDNRLVRTNKLGKWSNDALVEDNSPNKAKTHLLQISANLSMKEKQHFMLLQQEMTMFL